MLITETVVQDTHALDYRLPFQDGVHDIFVAYIADKGAHGELRMKAAKAEVVKGKIVKTWYHLKTH